MSSWTHKVLRQHVAGLQYGVVARYEGEYCGDKKIIYVEGNTDFGPIEKLRANDFEWKYAS